MIGVSIFIFLFSFTIISIREKEYRAARRAILLTLTLPFPYILAGYYNNNIISLLLAGLTFLLLLLLLIPLRPTVLRDNDVPASRIDERDIMFSRNKLIIGTDRFNEYYKNNPDKKDLDDKFRARPGLLKRSTKLYNPFSFSAAEASFSTVESLHQLVEKEQQADENYQADSEDLTTFIKEWAVKLGAISVGITELKNYHLYTTVGRGKDYGKPVDLDHKYALAFTVEMDKRMMDFAPHGPTVMESAQQYLNAGIIAVQITEFIRNLGYPARAHIDANYRVICPLVARDAGLGEIGRIGLLMTPVLGSRVRLGVVTTNIPLIPDQRIFDDTLINFCTICKKCAEACPPRALPFEDRKNEHGVKRWKLNSEMCFTYWCLIGTDCCRCIRVCPYSHPNSFLHKLVRKGIRNSRIFARFALLMDDFFYGRIPPTLKINKENSFDYFK